jgi:hypothetical protein
LGYGAAVLNKRGQLDIIDLNSKVCSNHRNKLRTVLSQLDRKPVTFDLSNLRLLNHDLLKNVEAGYENISWKTYESVFITMPSWFVNIPTENILTLAHIIHGESPESRIFYFGNSLGSWTDESRLTNNNINIVHLNDLFEISPTNAPVNYDLLPTPIYKNRDQYIFDILPFRLKHGCIWGKCRFCSLAKGWNSGYKERSAKKTILEIEELEKKYNPKMYACNDNSINGENLLDFCTYFEQFRKPWAGMARADLTDQEIAALGTSGCRLIYFGLESGSDRVLKRINKGLTSIQMSDFIKKLYDNNIIPAPSLIVGIPGETEDDFEKTIQFVLDHKTYFNILNAYPFMVSPGSDFYFMKEKENMNSVLRLFRLTQVCKENGIKVCVGEQNAEYVLYKAAYPYEVNY